VANLKVLIIKLSPIEGLNSSMIRTLALSKGLLELGYQIDFITIPISDCHVTTDNYDLIDKIKLIRTKQNSFYDSVASKKNRKHPIKNIAIKLLRKLYHKLSFYNYTYSIAKKIDISLLDLEFYDLVISSSDPKTSHIAMKELIKQGLKYKRWIQYWGDPMTLDITDKSIYPKWVIRNTEKKLLSAADKIIYVSPFTLEQQKRMFPQLADKMTFLPIPFIKEKYFKETSNSKFTIGYFGAYSSKVRNILPLYEAGKKMKESVLINILGDSDIQLEETENIRVYPRGDIDKFEKEADLLVCMLNRAGTQIPGKIYHYAATNKPILVLVDGDNRNEMKEYLQSFSRYIICDNEVESIINTIENIKMNPTIYSPCKAFRPQTIAMKFTE
jgi:hypothetical protein